MAVNIIDDDTIIEVTNMTGSRVVYVLDNGVHRRFAPHATIKIKAGELRDLSYQSGGVELLTNFLQVKNKELAAEFGVSEETVEYNWTESDVVNALTKDNINVLLDALDFAPEGIVQQLVEKAVELEITDLDKREAIKKATGKDISSMIVNKHAYDDDSDNAEKQPKTRRTAAKKTTQRRRVTKEEPEE